MTEVPGAGRAGEGPRAFRIAAAGEVQTGKQPVIRAEPDVFDLPDIAADPAPQTRKRFAWGGLLFSTLGGLLTLALGVGFFDFIVGLEARFPVLGWAAAWLGALAILAFTILLLREILGLIRLARLGRMRATAQAAINANDSARASAVVTGLLALYETRVETAAARAALAGEASAIMDAADRLGLAERLLLEPLDGRAHQLVAEASRQVAAVTALSPRAFVDIGFVLFAVARLIRRVAVLYGARPGFFGVLRLARSVGEHLLVTGGMAAGDTLIQQVLGQGLAAKLSARLGEGVLNGILTARVGLAAIAVCRPLPYVKASPPKLQNVAGRLLSSADEAVLR
jgi:putative membrane protein